VVVAFETVVPCIGHGEGVRVSYETFSSVHSDVNRSRHVCGYDVERRCLKVKGWYDSSCGMGCAVVSMKSQMQERNETFFQINLCLISVCRELLV
jgi:hypothetical protein